MHTVLSSRQITHSKLHISSKYTSLTHKQKAESERSRIFACTEHHCGQKPRLLYLGLKRKPATFDSMPHDYGHPCLMYLGFKQGTCNFLFHATRLWTPPSHVFRLQTGNLQHFIPCHTTTETPVSCI